MSTGLILIVAILVIGGVIATVGDRIGTKVGKARLSLFNLRPRRTATLITILTGIVVAASTLGILFATSGPLRTGVFELGTIQRKLRWARADLKGAKSQLETAQAQKKRTEAELNRAKAQEIAAQKQLTNTQKQIATIGGSLKSAIAERNRAMSDRVAIQRTLEQNRSQLQQNRSQLATISEQVLQFRSNISQLQAERSRVVAVAEEEINAKNAVINEREGRLKQLEAQQDLLVQEIGKLDREAEGLRRGNVAIQRGQVLSSAVVRILDPRSTQTAIDQLLREANRAATQLVRPGTKPQGQIIQITQAEVDQLIKQVSNGQDYVVRISAAANYLTGENLVQVFAEAARNQVVFREDDLIAATSLNPATLSEVQIQQRINLLVTAAGFRARRLGILTDTVQIGDGRVQDLLAFIEKLQGYNETIELRTIATETTFTAGPLKVNLVAVQNGKELLRSQ
ncbi:DUF3084 domain-containing protein [Phormidium sp. CLA17]|uniref:DUF3084 domain-containing protein n=1 Tax=Leptolyngbya sp. Cla-17 TaxID=2803751 RepID=UPI0014909BD2|nr:DUF3084 domain-containing protein [Leptolyngbya sp. Cla-17]MBM0743033.1 DUF3084 domain-containing protein [Leptolyngbya sp. Cla-17]